MHVLIFIKVLTLVSSNRGLKYAPLTLVALTVPFSVADQARKEFSEVETQISSVESRIS